MAAVIGQLPAKIDGVIDGRLHLPADGDRGEKKVPKSTHHAYLIVYPLFPVCTTVAVHRHQKSRRQSPMLSSSCSPPLGLNLPIVLGKVRLGRYRGPATLASD